MPVITHPNALLRQIARPISAEELAGEKMQELCDSMVTTMYADDGIGLAAVQVAQGVSIIIIGKDAFGASSSDLVISNPSLSHYSLEKATDEEGCLSVPGLIGDVERHVGVTLCGITRDGQSYERALTGYAARVAQHECDHLNGILYIDRATNIRPTQIRSAL